MRSIAELKAICEAAVAGYTDLMREPVPSYATKEELGVIEHVKQFNPAFVLKLLAVVRVANDGLEAIDGDGFRNCCLTYCKHPHDKRCSMNNALTALEQEL